MGVIRRLFTVASVVSLLLCVATVVLWVFSQFRQVGGTYYHASVVGYSFVQRNVSIYGEVSGFLIISSVVGIPGGSTEFLRKWQALRTADGWKDFDVQVTPKEAYRLGSPGG